MEPQVNKNKNKQIKQNRDWKLVGWLYQELYDHCYIFFKISFCLGPGHYDRAKKGTLNNKKQKLMRMVKVDSQLMIKSTPTIPSNNKNSAYEALSGDFPLL